MHIGFWELVVVFVVALLVVGPDKLPYYAKKLGEALQSFRDVSHELTDDLQKGVVEPLQEAQKPLRDAVQPLTDLADGVNADLKGLEQSVRELGKPAAAAKLDAETAAQPDPTPEPAPAGTPAPDMNYADGI